MVKVIIVVREVGRLKPEYSLDFELPEVPKVGSYISIHRPDKPLPHGEDMIVRQVWWRLEHPETASVQTGATKVGSVTEIMVECEQAIGPYSSDHWRDMLVNHQQHGKPVPEFEAERFSVREDEMTGAKKP